jgi:iron(III) transport system substrate-binding protein
MIDNRNQWLAAFFAAAIILSVGSQASGNGEVNIYSYRQPFLIEPMLSAFSRQTGIKTNVVYAPKGMLERLKREGTNSPADMVLTVDVGRLNDAVEAGVLQPVKTKKLLANIPTTDRDPNGLWYGLTRRARIIFASTARVKPSDLSTYESLVDAKWKGRICMRSSQHVYNVALLASLIAHHGEEKAEEWARGLKVNLARKPQGNDRAQVKAIFAGECDISLGNMYYMGKMLTNDKQIAWAKSVFMFFPNQNTYGTHINVSGAGVTKSAGRKANAIKLLEFLSDDEAQRMYAELNFEYPVKSGVPWSALVESWGSFKADNLDMVKVAQNRPLAVKIYDRVGIP